VAGLTAAYELHRRLGQRVDLLLISEHSHFRLGPALVNVAFGTRTKKVGFALKPALARHSIAFQQVVVERVDPQRRLVYAGGQEIAYDFLTITTGPAIDSGSIPGVGGEFNAGFFIHAEESAMETSQALARFLEHPGPAVVGVATGAAYLSAAYEFALQLDTALRRANKREQATITFITPETLLGHLSIGVAKAQHRIERLFAERKISVITGMDIQRVDSHQVTLRGGRIVPSVFTMVMPAFHGVPEIWKSAGLTDRHGYVPVDGYYRHHTFPEIYAAGMAAQVHGSPAHSGGVPKTGYMATVAAKQLAKNLAAAITWTAPDEPVLPRLRDLRILDGGDGGILLARFELRRPHHLVLQLPGRTASRLKRLLTRYILWKLRTGRTALP